MAVLLAAYRERWLQLQVSTAILALPKCDRLDVTTAIDNSDGRDVYDEGERNVFMDNNSEASKLDAPV